MRRDSRGTPCKRQNVTVLEIMHRFIFAFYKKTSYFTKADTRPTTLRWAAAQRATGHATSQVKAVANRAGRGELLTLPARSSRLEFAPDTPDKYR